MAKEVGPAVCSRTKEEKKDRLDHATVEEKVDMTKAVEVRGDVHVQVPGDDRGGAVEVPEGADMARDDECDDDCANPS